MAAFQKVRRIRSGGQGEVWAARWSGTAEQIAVKYMHDDPRSEDPEADLARFAREVRCQSVLKHDNIMPVIGLGLGGEPPFYIMPLASGSLRDTLNDGGDLIQEPWALNTFLAVLEAMEYAHSEGVLHRDLKPENILFVDSVPKVSDFGLGRRLLSESTHTLTVTNAAMGTLQYAAPEQFIDAHGVDETADIYSLGKILFELLTGRMPFPAVDTSLAPAKFRYIIGRCLENDPARRYQTVSELKGELEQLSGASTQLDPPLERAQALLADVLAGDRRALIELDRLLNSNGDDPILYKKFVPFMSAPVIAMYVTQHPTGFRSMLMQFDDYAAERHPFSYTDTIANFLHKVFDATIDANIRATALNRVLLLGYYHSRFHVGSTFADMAAKCVSTSDVLMVARILRDHPEAARWNADWLRDKSLPRAIVDAYQAA